MTQPIYAVTLAKLREHRACYSGYNQVVRMLQGEAFTAKDDDRESYIKFAHDEPISLVAIAKNNGIDDALWTLRCIPGCDRDARLFAIWCARQVEHLMTDQRSKDALNVAERFANGEATREELDAAMDAAWDAARAADRAAARAAARAAYWAAAWAAARAAYWAAAWDAARAAAWAAARAAYWAAAWDAARAAARAADSDADRAAARAAQLSMFIDMCEGRAPWQMASHASAA